MWGFFGKNNFMIGATRIDDPIIFIIDHIVVDYGKCNFLWFFAPGWHYLHVEDLLLFNCVGCLCIPLGFTSFFLEKKAAKVPHASLGVFASLMRYNNSSLTVAASTYMALPTLIFQFFNSSRSVGVVTSLPPTISQRSCHNK